MKIPGIMLSLTALGSILWVHSAPVLSAEAKHFRLSVPVKIENMPKTIGTLKLSCGVSKLPYPLRDGSFSIENTIGGMFLPIYLRGADYHGTMTFSFDAHPGKDPAQGKSYRCGLTYNDYDIGWLNFPQSNGYMKEFDYRDYWAQIWEVSGPIISGRISGPIKQGK